VVVRSDHGAGWLEEQQGFIWNHVAELCGVISIVASHGNYLARRTGGKQLDLVNGPYEATSVRILCPVSAIGVSIERVHLAVSE
jgi:hypothetical protein